MKKHTPHGRNASGEDKRQYARLPRPYRIEARELSFPIAKDPLIDSITSDISRGGLCIEAQSPLSVGTRLHVSVHIPLLNKFSSGFFKVYENDTDQYIQAIADVAWARPQGGSYLMGLHFVNLDDDVRRSLEKMIGKAFRDMEK